jgi:hypothetical protein
MEEWPKGQTEPKHVIIAYYPSTSLVEVTRDGKAAVREVLDRQERPLRVGLASESLIQEIKDITGISYGTELPVL